MQDIAALGFSIDSTQALGASQNLDKMRGSAENASLATRGLERQALDTQHGLGGLSDQTQQLSKNLDQIGSSFGALMDQMQKARAAFDGTTQSLKNWDTASQKVDALGRAFGTTAHGLEAFTQAAGKIGFTTEQQASSLQRMTLALENQTAAGAQLRRVMNEYGISIRDLNLEQADVLLQRVAASFSKVGDSAKRTRDAQALLGTLDPDSLGHVLAPNYVPIQQRHEQTLAQNLSLDQDQRYAAARAIERPISERRVQINDLQNNLPYAAAPYTSGGLSFDSHTLSRGMNTGDVAALRRLAPEGSAFLRDGLTSQEGKLAYLQQLKSTDLNPGKDDEGYLSGAYRRYQSASSGDGLFSGGFSSGVGKIAGIFGGGEEAGPATVADANKTADRRDAEEKAAIARRALGRTGIIGGTGAMLFDENGSSRLGRFYQHLTNGEYGADDAQNRALADEAYNKGEGNFATRGFDRFVRGAGNLFNTYRPELPAPPKPSPLDSIGDASTLSAFGDSSLQRYQYAQQQLKQFGRQAGDSSAFGQEGADTAGGEALATFGSYGKDAGAELKSRRAGVEAQQRNAFRPGGAAVDQADLEAKISSLPLAQQGKMRAFASFVAQRGGDTRLLLGQDVDSMLDPAKSGGGSISPQLVRDFNQSNTANNKASDDQFSAQSDLRQLNTYQQAGNATLGPNGAQDLATYQAAYNKALQETSRETEAVRRGEAALAQVQADRFLQATKITAETDRQNKLESDRIATVGSFQGSVSDARSVGYGAAVQKQLNDATARENLSPEQRAARGAGLAGQLGNEALDSVQSKALSTRQELQDTQTVAGFANESVATQARMNRELEVEKSYRDDIAKARAADAVDNGKRVTEIQAEVERIKTLKNAIAEMNAEAKAFSLGRDASQSAADENLIRSLPRSQQGRARALQPAMRFGRDNNLTGAQSADGDGSIITPGYGSPDPAGIDSFAHRMGLSESGGNNHTVNSRGYAGTYQFGTERLADKALGIYHPAQGENLKANQWRGSFSVPGFPDVHNIGDFLNSQDAQRTAFGMHVADIDSTIDQTPGASGYSRDGLRAVAHLGGSGGMQKFVGTRGAANPNDGRTSLSDYYSKFAGGDGPGSGGMSPGTGRYAQGLDDQYESGLAGQRQDLNAGADVQTRQNNAALPLIRQGRTADATIARQGQYDSLDPLNALRAELAIRQTLQGFKVEQATEAASTSQSISATQLLTAAYTEGGKAIGLVTDALKVQTEARTRNLTVAEQQTRMAQLQTERARQEGASIAQSNYASKDSNKLQETDNSLIFASDATRSRAASEVKLQQDLKNNFSNASQPERDSYTEQQRYNETLKETTTRVNELRGGFQSMSSSGISGINSLIMGTSSLKDTAASVTKEWAGMLLKMAEKPLMDAGGDWLSSLFKLGSTALSATSGVPGAGALSSGMSATSSFAASSYGAVPSAAGSAWMGGVRMFAGGGILDRPTHFFSAGGQPNVAGEAGNEAIMPLRRMPNGDMGIAAGGSAGGGANVTIHAPITVGAGAAGQDGKMSQAALDAMQKQLSDTMRQAMVATIADEKRPGGSLY